MFKNFIGSGAWKFQWVLALGFLMSGGAAAAPFEIVGNDPGTFSPLPNPFPLNANEWNIGSPAGGDQLDTGRVVVNGQAWTKVLDNPAGFDSASNPAPILHEYLTLTKGTVLTSWTETIINDEWVWDLGTLGMTIEVSNDDTYDQFVPPAPPHIVITPGLKVIKFEFNLDDAGFPTDLYPGGIDQFWLDNPDGFVLIDIHKSMRCTTLPEDGGCTTDITVVENAAPEPGTLLLLAGGLAGLAGLRRRRYA